MAAFDNYLHDGGFPELLNEKRKQTYINTLVDSILKKDIEKRYAVKYKAAFENIANHLLNNAPAKINYSELQNQFGLRSDHTAENYVNYTKNAYLVCGLHKYSPKSKIRIRDEKAYAAEPYLKSIPAYNEAIKSMTEEVGVTYIDYDPLWQSISNSYYDLDGIHPVSSFYTEQFLPYLLTEVGLNIDEE